LCIMVGFAIAYRLLCYAVLRFKLLRRRRWPNDWLTDWWQQSHNRASQWT
jgi:hypothetical protein